MPTWPPWNSKRASQLCRPRKKLIEQAYTLGAQLGLSVWCEDEAGPFQAVPHPGVSWQPREHPATQPHEYIVSVVWAAPSSVGLKG